MCAARNADAGQCNACAALGHHHPMPRYSTGVVALRQFARALQICAHFIFPLLSSKSSLLSLLISNNKLTPYQRERVSCLLISGPPPPGLHLRRRATTPGFQSSPRSTSALPSPPLLFNPPLLSHCKTGLRSPMTRAAHLILCSNSFTQINYSQSKAGGKCGVP